MGRGPTRSLRVAKSLVALAASAAFLPTARGQEIVRQWFGDKVSQAFGSPIALVGDVNADGFVDIVVAAPFDSTVLSQGGMLRVISGKDGAVLYTFYGDAANAHLGTLGQPIGDVDLDGYDDILVSEPEYGIRWPFLGRVFVYSGKDGSMLRTFTGNSTRRLNGSICGTGDIDGDGVPDLAASSRSDNYVTLFSGATKAEIRTLTASDPASTYFGHGLLNPGDIDGDGVNDLIILENSCHYPTEMHYYAFSGATGATIWQVQAHTYCYSGSSYGNVTCLSPVVIGDIDGDGIADWAMGSSSFVGRYASGYVTCFSGMDGSQLLMVFNPLPWYGVSTFGDAIAAAGDVNGDGVPDFAASDYGYYDDPGGDVFFYSGVDGAMLFHARGGANANYFGRGLAGGADTDGDGKLDFYVGDIYDSTNGIHSGAMSQLSIEPIVLDALQRVNPYYSTRIDVNGGAPGNPLAIFLVDVNGTTLFDLITVATFDSSRRLEQNWNVPSGLTGITARLLALTIDASGRLLKSNDETITFP